MISIGDFVIYKPKRKVLGYSSASTMGHAVPKPRPCCVVKIPEREGTLLVPLRGTNKNHAEWWHPVEFANSEQVPTTIDTHIPASNPIVVEYIHTGDTHVIKPSFIWVGDSGEFVLRKDVPGLRFIGNLHARASGANREDKTVYSQLLALGEINDNVQNCEIAHGLILG
ncbi:hypothetical protein BDR04DRAFT_1146079 [Suillus decipiens]|nr:hypothetical protein BDR04DRAFT_1146079 [Suillus decipiens]